MALSQETNILLLDEPTTYLVMAHQLEVLNIMQNLNKINGCTIVMVLHDINHAIRYSDELIAMRDGMMIKCGSPGTIKTEEVLKEVFNIKAQIMHDDEYDISLCGSYDVLK